MTSNKMTMIVAATQTMGIGVSGGLPWRLPAEMKYFAKATTGSECKNTVIMGRKTWESIPTKFRPLKSRRNIVVSRNPQSIDLTGYEETSACSSLQQALSSLPSSSSPSTPSKTFLIGGAQLYSQALESNLVNRVLFTQILDPAFEDCDVHIPDFRKEKGWVKREHAELERFVGFEVEKSPEEKGVTYRFEMWEKEG